MPSKRRHEGYLLLDHSESPGIQEEVAAKVLPTTKAGRGKFEAPTITCSHCNTVVIINPNRTRDRSYCSKCDHYICDSCGAAMAQTGICKPFKQFLDEEYDRIRSAETPGYSGLTVPATMSPIFSTSLN